MGKSVILTYIFWAFGGWFGLHHFYLGRDKQAFIWWTLVGGYCGSGLIVDFFRIPRYVQEANYEHEYVEEFKEYIKKKPKPPFSMYRFGGQIIFGNLLSWVIYAAIPVENLFFGTISLWWLIVLVPLGSAIGVYVVGNVGREEGSIRNALIAAYITLPFYTMSNPKYYWSSVLSALAFRTQLGWRKTPPKRKNICRRTTTLTVYGILYLSLWSSYLYFNMVITTDDGETIKFRDSVNNLLKSPMIVELRESLHTLWQYYRIHGFSSMWGEVIARFDPLGESNALRLLDLPKGATQEQVTQRWRQLSKQWHPDKFQDEEEKANAQKKFMEITEAHDKLSVIHAKRKQRNARSRATEKDSYERREERQSHSSYRTEF